MGKVTLEFTVGDDGDPSLLIKGIKGKGCRPIHDAVSASLKSELGVTESQAQDTPEAGQASLQLHQQAHVRT